jgi:hypothetical protein
LLDLWWITLCRTWVIGTIVQNVFIFTQDFFIIEYIWNMDMKLCMGTWLYFKLRTSPLTLSMWLYKNICHIQVLVNKSFPTPPIKLKLGLLISARLLIATHWTNQTMLPIRNMEQSINMIQLYLVDFSKVPLRL